LLYASAHLRSFVCEKQFSIQTAEAGIQGFRCQFQATIDLLESTNRPIQANAGRISLSAIMFWPWPGVAARKAVQGAEYRGHVLACADPASPIPRKAAPGEGFRNAVSLRDVTCKRVCTPARMNMGSHTY